MEPPFNRVQLRPNPANQWQVADTRLVKDKITRLVCIESRGAAPTEHQTLRARFLAELAFYTSEEEPGTIDHN
jgi:hypothetical protein